MVTTQQYQVIVIGGGPAGLTAALYAQRAGYHTLVIEKMVPGGQVNLAKSIENYPGISTITGSDLADQMYAQVQAAGVEFLFDDVDRVDLTTKTVFTPELVAQAPVIIIATGAGPRKTAAAGENKFLSNGVHYCATCDGGLYRGQDVVMVGGSQAALEDALYLAAICRSVTIVNPLSTFNAPANVQQAIADQPNIRAVYHASQVVEICGDRQIEAIKIANTVTHEQQQIACQGVFVAIGRMPNIDLFQGQLKLGAGDYILTDAQCATNVPGVYAAGDVRAKTCRQIVTAVADGAIAATAAINYLQTLGVNHHD